VGDNGRRHRYSTNNIAAEMAAFADTTKKAAQRDAGGLFYRILRAV
jgi:hypothetical protein